MNAAPPLLPYPLLRHLGPAAIVYGGNMARAGLGLIMTLLVARLLGPEQFGLFSLFIVVMVLCHNLAGEGLDAGVVRFYSLYLHTDPERANGVLGAALTLRIVAATALALAIWVGAEWIAASWLRAPATVWIIRLGALSAVVAALCSLALALLQARERFLAYAMLTAMTNLLRIVSVPVLLLASQFTLGTVMGSHALFFFLAAMTGMALLLQPLSSARFDVRSLSELLRFSGWTWIASLCFLIQGYLSVPLLKRYDDATAAGLFSAALTLLLVVDQLTASMIATWAPRLARITDRAELRDRLHQGLPRMLRLALPLSIGMLIAGPLIGLIYGPAYQPAASAFRILLPGFLATLLTQPLSLAFHALGRPKLSAATGVCALVTWVACASALIPSQGLAGAAWAVTIARLVQASMIVALLATAVGPFWRVRADAGAIG